MLALNVRTRYVDVSELVMHLAARMDAERLVLATASRMPKGDWVKFIVSLSDGTSVLEGIGKIHDWRERGKNAKLHERYDIHLDSLQFDEKNEIMWERIQLARDSDRSTGEVDLESIRTQHEKTLRDETHHDLEAPPKADRKSVV